MKKKYGLDSIIGRKSKLRFPHHVYVPKADTLNFTIQANNVTPEPPLSTAVTIRKGDCFQLCDELNEATASFEQNFPLIVSLYISNGEILFEIKNPSVFNLITLAHNLENKNTPKMRVNSIYCLLACVNFSLIALNPSTDFFISDLVSKVKSIYTNIFSYNAKRRYLRLPRKYTSSIRLRKDLVAKRPYHQGKKVKRKFIQKFIRKARRKLRIKRIRRKTALIYRIMDLEDAWDDIYDFYHENISDNVIIDLIKLNEASWYFNVLEKNLDLDRLTLETLLSLRKYTKGLPKPTDVFDHIVPLRFNAAQFVHDIKDPESIEEVSYPFENDEDFDKDSIDDPDKGYNDDDDYDYLLYDPSEEY